MFCKTFSSPECDLVASRLCIIISMVTMFTVCLGGWISELVTSIVLYGTSADQTGKHRTVLWPLLSAHKKIDNDIANCSRRKSFTVA